MTPLKPLRLSDLMEAIRETIDDRFEDEVFWIKTEITDVKKYADKRWCFLKFIEKSGSSIIAESRAVFWSNSYYTIEKFETLTRQKFTDGIEITCLAAVRFHNRYGLSLEVLEIDYSFTLGKLELEKQETLLRLTQEYPGQINLVDDRYVTVNNTLELPRVIQKIALITAPGSDGRRDFIHELESNPYGYAFGIKEYLTQIQGDQAAGMIVSCFDKIAKSGIRYDAVAVVRGGGSITDLKPFDDYELARTIALFPIPVLTGIGHDRNISISDLMARPMKTPTKVAGFISDHNYQFENDILEMKNRLFLKVGEIIRGHEVQLNEAKKSLVKNLAIYLNNRRREISNFKRLVTGLSPSSILRRGFAILTSEGKIISDPSKIRISSEITAILKNENIIAKVIDKKPYENEPDL